MRRRGLETWKPYDWRSWRWWPRWVWMVVGAETLYLLYFTVSFRSAPDVLRVPVFADARPLILGQDGLVSTLLWINLCIVIALWATARIEMNVRNERAVTMVVLPPALVLMALSVLIWQYAAAWWVHPVDTVIERQDTGRYTIVAQRVGSRVRGLHEWIDSLGR